jgi:hypothetical protein
MAVQLRELLLMFSEEAGWSPFETRPTEPDLSRFRKLQADRTRETTARYKRKIARWKRRQGSR